VWYRIVGIHEEQRTLPLLCLHGGPGMPHDYLEPLEALAASGRRVIFYDQLGCGHSDKPHDPSLWTVDLFVEEVGVVRRALGLDHLHLLGQSWGGMLALEYALTQPAGLASLIIASAGASMHQWVAELKRLRAELPPEVQEILLRHEQAGTTGDPAYEAAMRVFDHRHFCRLASWPEYLNRAIEKSAAFPEVGNVLTGSDAFDATGVNKNWTVIDRLGEIRVPTLVTCGHYDLATPAMVETVHRGIDGSEWVVFEQSAHLPHAEEPERYLQVLNDFLSRVEAGL
jgi:proline-specific peptidase